MRTRSAFIAAVVLLAGVKLAAAETLVIDSWGGKFPKSVEEFIVGKFKTETGADVEFITGGTIDRLNKAKLMKAQPESDITFTTAHVGWLYVNDGLFEKLDLSRMPNAANLISTAKISDYHVAAYGYVYTIAYRTDMVPEGITFETWEDLWHPELKGMISAADFDPSHVISVAAHLAGADVATWEKGQEKLLALKPNFKAFFTNDANSIQLFSSGETPVQVLLSSNGYHMMEQGVPMKIVVPKEGAVLGIDTVAITKGSKNLDLAYKFINIVLSREVQKEWSEAEMRSPAVAGVAIDPAVASLPGVMTTEEQWTSLTLPLDQKVRAEKLTEWRKWFTENMIAN